MNEDGIDQALRRIEALIAALDSLQDPAAREPARALLELILEFHALGLARMTAMIASSSNGTGLLQRIAEDEAARSILLLHGLHPETVEMRVAKAVEDLRAELAGFGLGIKLINSSAKLARVRARWIGASPSCADIAAWREKIEAAIVEAAPDLETLEIEGFDETVAALAS